MIAAIITARGNNETIQDKNIVLVGGVPLIVHQINAAHASRIDKLFVATDCEKIATTASKYGATDIIWRPDHLKGAEVNHGDVIVHAADEVKAKHSDLEIVVILLGNTAMLSGVEIDACITEVEQGATGCMTVWKAQDDHPLRATVIEDGYLRAYDDACGIPDTNRQSYPDVYFYDQGPWVVRYDVMKSRTGPGPWWWMGDKCKAVERPWITGRDIHTDLDLWITEAWLRE